MVKNYHVDYIIEPGTRADVLNVSDWGVWVKGIWEFLVLLLQYFRKFEIVSENKV